MLLLNEKYFSESANTLLVNEFKSESCNHKQLDVQMAKVDGKILLIV